MNRRVQEPCVEMGKIPRVLVPKGLLSVYRLGAHFSYLVHEVHIFVKRLLNPPELRVPLWVVWREVVLDVCTLLFGEIRIVCNIAVFKI